MGWFWKKPGSNGKTKSYVCPVCRGRRIVRTTAEERNLWREQTLTDTLSDSGTFDVPCWACNGAGRVQAAAPRYVNRRFEK
jgi:DnaJ-class molecular chaperone